MFTAVNPTGVVTGPGTPLFASCKYSTIKSPSTISEGSACVEAITLLALLLNVNPDIIN